MNSYTHLEHLSNELFYEIFDLLDFCHVYQAFTNLNSRFEQLLIDSTFPIRMKLLSISKRTFQYYHTHIILPYQHRIQSFHLSNLFVIDQLFYSPSAVLHFPRLAHLYLENIDSEHVEMILIHLMFLPCLSSLTIMCMNDVVNKNLVYQQLFRLPALKYCQFSIKGMNIFDPLSLATNEFSSIEHLVIQSQIYIPELHALLSYMPQIRRLSVRDLRQYDLEQTKMHPIELNHLMHVCLILHDVTFQAFESMIEGLFHQIQILFLSTKNDFIYLDANQWERLIVLHLPKLQIFDLQYEHSRSKIVYLLGDDLFNQFRSSFWYQRKWFFAYYIHHDECYRHLIFYSTNPYRRKHYIFHEQTSVSNHFKSVNHVEIRSGKALRTCSNYFPNVTTLTVSHEFIEKSKIPLLTQLHQFLPLKQLTELVLRCNSPCLSTLVELLRYTPVIHTIDINYLSRDQRERTYYTNFKSLKQNETFRSVSETNNIRHLTIISYYPIEFIQFFLRLCPRLQHLTTNNPLYSIEQLLQCSLSKSNAHTGHIVSLNVVHLDEFDVKRLRALAESVALLADCSINVPSKSTGSAYLWR